jgi:AmmeMemoRadiSam system protein B
MKKVIVGTCLVFILSMSVIIVGICKYQSNILTVVIPHHNLVKKERLDFWNKVITKTHIKPNEIKRVIIIGPDHFGSIQSNITYDDSNWTTYSTDIQNFFKKPDFFPNNYVLNSKITKKDHAMTNLISEIHDNFPNAEFVPFIIGKKVKFAELTYLIDYINNVCNKNCILVTSVDFSHYVTLDVANKQDERTIKLLQNKKIKEDSLNQNNTIEADSPAALYIMQEFARKKGLDWWLYNQTNSAFGNTQTTDTTSHVYGAFINK